MTLWAAFVDLISGALFALAGAFGGNMAAAIGLAAQSPIFMALYSAIKRGLGHAQRFWWIKDLAKPDGILLAITSVMMGITATLGPTVSSQNRYALFLVSAILGAILFAKLAAGVMIYTLTSSGVGVVQAVLVRRHARRFAN